MSRKYLSKARSFFKKIGLPFQEVKSFECLSPDATFFDGVWLERGRLYYCPKYVQVGELLHEAGHLALLPPAAWELLRPGSLDAVAACQPFGIATDYAVEAWDFAAAIAGGIPTIEVTRKGFGSAPEDSPLYSLNGLEVWGSLVQQEHPGIKLLTVAGMVPMEGYPKMNRWFYGDREPIDLDVDLTMMESISTSDPHEQVEVLRSMGVQVELDENEQLRFV